MNFGLKTFIGDEDKFPLEHRIFNNVLIVGILICLLSTMLNYFTGLNALVTLVGAMGLIFLYRASAINNNYRIAINLGLPLFLFIFLPLFWVTGAGTVGGYPYYAIVTTSVIIFLTSGLKRKIYFLCLFLIVLTMLVIEFYYPNLIKDFSSSTDRFIDVDYPVSLWTIFLPKSTLPLPKSTIVETIG
jgi:hypothetical protein